MLDGIIVPLGAGESMPLSKLATVSIKSNSVLSVNVHEMEHVKSVDKAVRAHELALNPTPDPNIPTTLLVPVPK
jgi:ribosome recycling factor